MTPELEICCSSAADVERAIAGGATRVELCRDLGCGGLTPDDESVRRAVTLCGDHTQLSVLLRSRAGDFCYTEAEVSAMASDLRRLQQLGIRAVSLGALTPGHDIDTDAMRRWLEAAPGLTVTFHRAFDLIADKERAMAALADMGVRRILTSGSTPRALDNIAELRQLVRRCPPQIYIMVCGTVRPDNLPALVAGIGARAYHSAARPCADTPVDTTTVLSLRQILQSSHLCHDDTSSSPFSSP